jgi:hypothetical protein
MFNLYYDYLYGVFCYTLEALVIFTLKQVTDAQKWGRGTALLFL